MKFELIEVSKWKRKAYFNQYLKECPCNYSMTVNFDIITMLRKMKQKNIKLYPSVIYLITRMVNQYEEFRTQIDNRRLAFS